MTLTNLEKVSASLGAKAILWELFNFNPPSLRLYVELCATSQFLSEILINNPGDDRRPGRFAGGGSALAWRGDQGRAGRAVQGGRRPGADPLELSQQGVGADRHAAISWAASRFARSRASWPTWPRRSSPRWRATNGSAR